MTLGDRAKEMRNAPTEPKKRLWRQLSNSQTGFKFRRQAVIAWYIADFLCPAKAPIVEVDGETHHQQADKKRDVFLAEQGYRTIHFTNADVMTNIDGVLEVITSTAASLPDRWPHPNPSPEGEGLERSPAP